MAPLKYASARSAWAENYGMSIMLHLKRVKLIACSQKICCISTPNFFPFLPYQSIVISISVSSVLLQYLSPDLHGSHLPFSCKFTSVKQDFSCDLMGNSPTEASSSEMYGFSRWPPPRGYAQRHDDNLTFRCAAFSSSAHARWW